MMGTLRQLAHRGALAKWAACPLLLLEFAFLPLATQAANIEVLADETQEHPALILIKGQFLKSEVQHDVTTFATLAVMQKKPAIVFLESQGGMTWTALQIGKIIQQHGFSTAVVDEAVCASSCALIWLAGKERFMAPTSRIGFHASSTVENPGVEVSSYGNAVIGAFLYEIGLREPATIVYLTKASPQSMTWLTMADATRYGISVKSFSLERNGWSWARSALKGSGGGRRIDPPSPVPATRPSGAGAERIGTLCDEMIRALGRPLICSASDKINTVQVRPVSLPASDVARIAAERQRALGLHEEGTEQLERGNVFAARRFFESAAEAGLGQSAMALAATYDPNELAKLKNVGVVPEVDAARRWYEKARELGEVEATERLRRLRVPNQRASGYVAVLVSNKNSRTDALNALAELQQKYGDVLAAKTLDVEEFHFADRVVWYRVVVGPGSHQAATSLCSQLREAGHTSCWVADY
jgi:hypothetical protein